MSPEHTQPRHHSPKTYRRSATPEGGSTSATPRLPATISADEAFRLLGIDKSTGYRAIKQGTFPLPYLRVGRIIRVPTVPVLRLLQLDGAASPSNDVRQPEEPGAA